MSTYDYDMIVLGAGAAGLSASGFAAALGARTLLVESGRTGGECTWTGCIPSKALVAAARRAHEIRTAGRFGIGAAEPEIDFERVMRTVRAMRRRIYETADAPDVIRARNIDLVSATATFLDPHTLQLDGEEQRRVTTRYAIIATGSLPAMPYIAGLAPQRLHTNATIFEINEQPGRLLVLGAGASGVELAQAFARLGSTVTLVEREDEILGSSEPACAAHVREALEGEGLAVLRSSTIDSVSSDADGTSALVTSGDRWRSVRFDTLLVAAGRRPAVEALDLDAAGVAFTGRGITINHSCQTSASHIYACGDVTDGPHFTHAAEDMARTAVMRLLLKVPAAYERRCLPSVTFSDPELGRVGQTSEALAAAGTRFETIRFPYARLDRSVIDGTDDGFMVVHVAPASGKLLGAHIVGERAGDLVNEFALAMHAGMTLRDISAVVHAYPTYSLGVRRVADQWYVRSGSPRLVETLRSIFGYRGRASEKLGTTDVV